MNNLWQGVRTNEVGEVLLARVKIVATILLTVGHGLTVQILHPYTNTRQLQCAKTRQAAVFHPDAKPARRAY